MEEVSIQRENCFLLCENCHSRITTCNDEYINTKCPICGHLHKEKKSNSDLTLTFAFTALILYFPANMLPFMTMEIYGNKTQATIWSGIVTLSEGGSWPLAVIVFIASMLVPFIKLAVLFYLSIFGSNGHNQNFKTKLYKFIEVIGPWSMLDIFLLAVLIAVLKFDSLANVSVGLGSWMFLLVVIFTMLSSASFNPKSIWKKE